MAIKLPINSVQVKPKSMYKKNKSKVSRVPRFTILGLVLAGILFLGLFVSGAMNFNSGGEASNETEVVESAQQVTEKVPETVVKPVVEKVVKSLVTTNGDCEFTLSEVAPSGVKYQSVTGASAEYWWVNTECASDDVKGVRVVRYAVENQNSFADASANKVFSSATTSWAVALYQGGEVEGVDINRYKSVLLNPVLNGADFYNVDQSEGSLSRGQYTYYLSNGCLDEELGCAVWRLDLSSDDQEEIYTTDGEVSLTPKQPNEDSITLSKVINGNSYQILVINEETLQTAFDFETLVGSELYDEYF